MPKYRAKLSNGQVLEFEADDDNDASLRAKNLASRGPKLRPGPGQDMSAPAWPDTSAEAADVLRRHPEPNRAQDVLPKLAEFAVLGSAPAGIASAASRGMAALRGLSSAEKAASVATAAGKAAAYGAAGMAADQGLKAVGVPAGVSEMVVMGAGLGTRPGREAIKAGARALMSAEAAAPAAVATAARTAVPEAAASAADDIAAKIISLKTKQGLSGAQISASLRDVYGIPTKDGDKMVKMVLENAGLSPLREPRIQEGAQRVARAAGLTKEEVRKITGPVLDEAAGEASPILPLKAFTKIVDTMRAMPMAEREAYVARATSGKAKWQIENIRRQLEHLGLLLPAGAAGAAMSE